MKITGYRTYDVRFPTSREADGSDAMNPDPDYSAAYVVFDTDGAPSLEGHGLTFTIGRGNELCVQAIEILAAPLVGLDLRSVTEDWGGFWRRLTGDSHLRWLGPEKGVVHLATGAVVNAFWDLHAKSLGKPLWRVLAEMSPHEIVGAVDFRYITDCIDEEEAVELLSSREGGRAERIARVERGGFPAYTTSVGWMGYDDDKIRRLCREAVAEGWDAFKMKVGRSLDDDVRRAAVIREEIGWKRSLMMDANQIWDVEPAIAWMKELARFEPQWIEEPTSPDDVLGHQRLARELAPIGVATGEHAHNRVMFKQLLQAGAIRFCQIDACRLGGVNEVIAVLLMAAKHGVPVCPHAGGVGLCEYVQHLALFDYVAVSGTSRYVDHLHEHFEDPVRVEKGRYLVPERPGFSITMKESSREAFRYPDGSEWRHLGSSKRS